jgi:hypothetical protein
MKIVAAGLIKENGKYILARRGPGQHFEDFWEFPWESRRRMKRCKNVSIFPGCGRHILKKATYPLILTISNNEPRVFRGFPPCHRSFILSVCNSRVSAN